MTGVAKQTNFHGGAPARCELAQRAHDEGGMVDAADPRALLGELSSGAPPDHARPLSEPAEDARAHAGERAWAEDGGRAELLGRVEDRVVPPGGGFTGFFAVTTMYQAPLQTHIRHTCQCAAIGWS